MSGTLFDTSPHPRGPQSPAPPARRDAEQAAQLARVKGNIGEAVRAFLRERIDTGRREFHGVDLAVYVCARAGCSPSSCDRVMRDMNATGEIAYTLLSKTDSHYRADRA